MPMNGYVNVYIHSITFSCLVDATIAEAIKSIKEIYGIKHGYLIDRQRAMMAPSAKIGDCASPLRFLIGRPLLKSSLQGYLNLLCAHVIILFYFILSIMY